MVRVGWFVRGRKGRGCHSQKSLRAPLVSLASSPSLSLSLVYQSLRFRNYFYVPSSKAGHARAQRLSRDRSRIHPKFADLKRSARFHSFRAKIFGMKNSSPRSYKKGLFFYITNSSLLFLEIGCNRCNNNNERILYFRKAGRGISPIVTETFENCSKYRDLRPIL